jgi:hypothetical protein
VTYTISVKACDPERLCDEKRFQITVKNTNRPPILKAIPDKRIEEGKTFAFRVEASDPDGDPVKLSVGNLPPGATFEDHGNGTGTFLWASRLDQAGRYVLAFTASDGQLEDREQVLVTLDEVSRSISGVIKDQFNRPLAGVTVKCTGPGQLARFATTDANGYYLLTDLPAGPWTLKPEHAPSGEFSPQARKSLSYHFSPLSRRVVLERSDAVGNDFTAIQK